MTAKAAATLCFCISVSSTTGGCGRYADFSLPVLASASKAQAPQFTFAPQPVLGRGTWDTGDVLNPSVAVFQGVYYNLYSGFDGHTWHTGLATSPDGVAWVKQGKVLSPSSATWEGGYIAANGSVLEVRGELWYWYQAGDRDHPRIGLARSRDGRIWRKEAEPVLGFGPYLSWDEEAVADPFVLKKDDWFYLYYLGANRARQQQLGVARSRDGVRWQKLRANPVVAMSLPEVDADAENGWGEPAVWERDGAYWMLATARDSHEKRTLRLMRSADGVHWTVMGGAIRGAEPWNAAVICDAAVLKDRFWFGGGDVPSPDENLHGQIGTGEIKSVRKF